MKIIKVIFNFIYWAITFCLIVVAGVFAFSNLKLSNNGRLLVVQSGSMEPSVKIGSLIVIKKQDTYSIGDIITFNAGGFDSTTHRVVKTEVSGGKEFFSTRGDANQAADRESVSVENVNGKAVFILPYLGFLISFTKNQMGFIFLIVVPATIVIFSEILNLKKEIVKLIEKRKEKAFLPAEKGQWPFVTHD